LRRYGTPVSPRHVPASITELQRIGLFGSLPGATLTLLSSRMTREEIPAGQRIVTEDELTDRFYVLLSGLAGVSQSGRGARGVLRPGDTFGEVAPALGVARTATVTAMTGCTIASCDRATFDELLKPLFATVDE
jgi:CRP-like cAMP-binding protein